MPLEDGPAAASKRRSGLRAKGLGRCVPVLFVVGLLSLLGGACDGSGKVATSPDPETTAAFLEETTGARRTGPVGPAVPGERAELVFVEDAVADEVIVLTRTGEVVERIRVGREPHDIALSPDGSYIATGNFGDGTVSIVSVESLSLERTIATGRGTHGVAFGPDGRYLFATNAQEDTLSVIEAGTFSHEAKIRVGDFPEYVGVTGDGSTVFTTNLGGEGSVTLLDNRGPDSRVTREFGLGLDPHGWDVSPDGTKIAIANLGSASVYLLDAATFAQTARFDTGATREFVPFLTEDAAFLTDDEVWVTNIGTDYVSILDLAKNRTAGRIAVGPTPHGVAFSRDRSLAFVSLYKPGELVIVDVAKEAVIERVRVGEELHNVATT